MTIIKKDFSVHEAVKIEFGCMDAETRNYNENMVLFFDCLTNEWTTLKCSEIYAITA